MKSEVGRPPILFVGASHVTHLETFVKKRITPFKYSYPFRNSFFLQVGGAKWEDCLDKFCGINLSKNNKHLGNQWTKYHLSPIKPVYTVILLGSNSVDEFDRSVVKLKQRYKMDSQLSGKRLDPCSLPSWQNSSPSFWES